MRARALVVASPGSRPGEVRYDSLRSDPPLLLRPTAEGLHLVGGAAGPLGGDELDLEVRVRAGGRLCVRSAGASIVLPGPGRSDVRVHATVEHGAELHWAPEPTVSVVASRHRQLSVVQLQGDARVHWSEVLVLGRSAEIGGAVEATLRVEQDGRAVVHQSLACGPPTPGWDGAATLGPHRVVATTLFTAPAGTAPASATHHDPSTGARAMSAAVSERVVMVQAVGPDVPSATAVLRSLANSAGPG